MLRPRWSTRTGIIAIVAIAIALRLTTQAFWMWADYGYHIHTHVVISPDGREMFVGPVMIREPFWPRYWRYLLGRPWKAQPLCGPGDRASYEACQLAHPGIILKNADGSIDGVDLSPGQRAEYDRLKGLDASAIAYGLDRRPIP